MLMVIELLKIACEALDKEEIPYMLSGSVAMNVYTVPRMTRDIDIVISLRFEDIDKFAKIFEEGFYIYKEGIEEEIRRRGMFNVIDFKSGQKIDFIVRKNTAFHLNEFERRRRISTFGFDVWIVSIEDLIIAKIIWIQELQSDRQMGDIQNLFDNTTVDKEYVINWCKELSLNTFNLIPA